MGTWGFPKLPGEDLHWSCLPSTSALSAPRFCSACKMQITANILKFMLTCQATNLPAAQLPAMFGFLLNCLQTASFIELVGLCFPGGSFPPGLVTAFAVNPSSPWHWRVLFGICLAGQDKCMVGEPCHNFTLLISSPSWLLCQEPHRPTTMTGGLALTQCPHHLQGGPSSSHSPSAHFLGSSIIPLTL